MGYGEFFLKGKKNRKIEKIGNYTCTQTHIISIFICIFMAFAIDTNQWVSRSTCSYSTSAISSCRPFISGVHMHVKLWITSSAQVKTCSLSLQTKP